MQDACSILFRHVSKHHGRHETLRDINLAIRRGAVTVICGPSGAGKTTLLRLVNGLEQPDQGTIIVEGKRLPDPHLDLALLRSDVGMVFQHLHLYPHLTVLDNITLAPRKVRKLSRAAARELASDLLGRFGLAMKRDCYPATLSGGEMQRVAIARSLAMGPKVLLLDEPTSALDPELTGDMLGVITNLAEGGMTLIVVTHEMWLARSLADEVVFMDAGRIVERGKPSEVIDRPAVERTRQFMSRVQHGDILDATARPADGTI
jgi:ABC-type polar amino acid transport system ATPase subunit